MIFCCFEAKTTTCSSFMLIFSSYSFSFFLSLYIEFLSHQRIILINLSHCRRMLFSLLSLSSLTLSLVAIVAASWICLNYSTSIQVTLRCRVSTVSAMMSFAITKWARRSAWAKRLLISLVSMMRRWRNLTIKKDLTEMSWRRLEKREKRDAEERNEEAMTLMKARELMMQL